MPRMQEATVNRDAAATLRRTLADAVGADGGWPYYPGRASRIEPTCWALLALSAGDEKPGLENIDRARAFLRGQQRDDGLLVEGESPSPNYAWNGLALLADTVIDGAPTSPWRDRLVAGLLAAKGVALDDNPSIPQNNRLQAWSWIDGTFSWIEPTAVCLLALKKARAPGPLAMARIAEAEAMVVDRVCDGGGWNYGNAQVLTQDLRPYVPTTALALLAMQDHPQHPVVTQSLDWLVAHATAERASMALSLAAVCLHVFGHSASAPLALLAEQQAKTEFLGNAHLIAMALYALSLWKHEAEAFVTS